MVEIATVQAQVPAGLLLQAETLVEDGWFEDVNDAIADALRRFLEARRPELMESYIWRDVEWDCMARTGSKLIRRKRVRQIEGE